MPAHAPINLHDPLVATDRRSFYLTARRGLASALLGLLVVAQEPVAFSVEHVAAESVLTAGGVVTPPPGPDHFCVRNFYNNRLGSPAVQADTAGGPFARIKPAGESSKIIWTKIYAELYCETAPLEFGYVETYDGAKVCTVNYHQPGVAEYCYSNPKIFAWGRAYRSQE